MAYNELNTVSTFVLPFLRIEPIVFKGRIVNSYLYDEDVEAYRDNHIFVVHSNKQDREFVHFETILARHDCFVDSYDIVDTFFGVKVFKVPEVFEENYQNFLKGKYSRYDLAGKGTCFNFGLLPETRILHHVFTRSKELRELKESSLGIYLSEESELWSIWNPKFDVLTPDIKVYLRGLCKTKVTPNTEFLDT